MSGSAISISVPEELIRVLAAQVVDEIKRSGVLASAPESPWLSSDEAAQYLRCSKQRVFDLASQGRLPVAKDGSRSLYRREEFDAYLLADRGVS